MARRKPYTEVQKRNQMRPSRVSGQSDVLYRRFECMSPACSHTLVIADDECQPEFSITCPACGFLHFSGGTLELFDYAVVEKATGATLKEGPFAATHDAYVGGSDRVKYCLNCYTMQPLANFDRHASRKRTQRQGECRMCKQVYNDLKNDSRLAEQHREASDTRRLLTALSGETRIGTIDELLERFGHTCFNCDQPLDGDPGAENGYRLDHTLPVSWLWPLDHGPTVLCAACNGSKRNHWPSDFYDGDAKLRTLSIKTGILFEVLAGAPFFNPDALDRLRSDPDGVIERWVDHPEKLRVLRTRILATTGEEIFAAAGAPALRAIGLVA